MSSVYVITSDDIEDSSAEYIFTSLDETKAVFSYLTGTPIEDVHLVGEFVWDGEMGGDDWLNLHYKMYPRHTFRYICEHELNVRPEGMR